MSHDDELYHYGVKGMKWGVRRFQNKVGELTAAGRERYRAKETAKREKFTNMAKRGRLSDFEKRIINQRNQNVSKRVARTAAYTALNELMIDAVTGRLGKYTTVKGLAQKGATIAAKTGINSAVNNYLANSIAKRYNTDGSLAAGQKRTGGRKEKAISQSIKIASTIAPILLNVASYNYKKARYERAVNEEKSRSWGSRILTEKTRNVVWADPESGTYVFDPN